MEKRTDRVEKRGGAFCCPSRGGNLSRNRRQGPHEFGLREMDPRWIVVETSIRSAPRTPSATQRR